MPAPTNTTVFRLLLTLVLLAPLPLASNRPWAWSLLAVVVGLLLLVWSMGVLVGSARAPVPVRWLRGIAVPFTLALAWAALQSLDVVPSAWWHPLWGEAAHALERPVAGGVSIDPGMSRTAVLRLLTYAGVFWLAVQLGRDRSRARETLVLLALGNAAYAAYGLSVHFSGQERILWLEKWAYPGDLTSTFVNRNAYGAYAGLGVLCCLALFLHAMRPARPGTTRRIYDFTETVLLRAMPFLVGALVIGTALLLSHSRGAFLSTGVGILVLIVAFVAGRMATPRMALVLALVIGAAGLGVLSLSGGGTVERLVATDAASNDHDRAQLYRLAVDAIGDAPWTGHGLGAFLPAFRVYRDAELWVPMVWDFAHNVHLETAMDLGLPAAGALYLSLAVVLAICLRGLVSRRRDQTYPAMAIASTVLFAVHGVVDFSIQMPAIAITWALLLGVGVAQSWRTAEGEAS